MQSAFTLAEVLITLGIIGVVAAMTLPTVINNSKSKENEALLKKAYSTLSQAIAAMEYDMGTTITPPSDNDYSFVTNFRNYFRLYSTCNSYNCIKGESGTDDDGNSYYGRYEDYKTFDKKSIINNNPLFDNGTMIFSDSMLLMIEAHQGRLYLTVDVNGTNYKPNVWGQDLFTFQITKDGKFLPMGADGTDYTDINQYCSLNSTHKYNGIACTYKALTDPNYFKQFR